MLIYHILSTWARVAAADDAHRRAGYEAAPPTVKAALTRARTALDAELRRAWPEYGRKIDTGWWAGPDYVQPERDPQVVASISLGCSAYGVHAHDGLTNQISGCTSPERSPDLYQSGPLGMLVLDKRRDPTAVYAAPLLDVESMAGRPRYDGTYADDPISLARLTPAEYAARVLHLATSPLAVTPAECASERHPDDWIAVEGYDGTPHRERGPKWAAAYEEHRATGAPTGTTYVGMLWYAAFWLRHGASLGYRSHRDAITWIAGPRAGEVGRFRPAPFYPDEHQPPAMRGAPDWSSADVNP